LQEVSLADLVYLAITVAAFAIFAIAVRAAERM